MRHDLKVRVRLQGQQGCQRRRRNNRSQKIFCHRRVLEAYAKHVRTIKTQGRIPEGVPVNMAGLGQERANVVMEYACALLCAVFEIKSHFKDLQREHSGRPKIEK